MNANYIKESGKEDSIMSKVGKTLNHMTDATIKASGVVTKKTGEFMADACKAVGINKDTCERMEEKADELGKDMYYNGAKVGKKVGQAADDMMDQSKKAIDSIIDKFKD